MYFLRYNGKVRGPFDTSQIDRLVFQGKVPGSAEVSLDKRIWSPLSARANLHAGPTDLPVLDALPLEAEPAAELLSLDRPGGAPGNDPADLLGELDWSKWADDE